ncbi:hypothetical protein BGZ60DRAFT_401452 [Tricladium varicosporioides]|nr:hypothetical protein BGZ60DRAFT_401452 [Hymenoscyphus varicosporioides]
MGIWRLAFDGAPSSNMYGIDIVSHRDVGFGFFHDQIHFKESLSKRISCLMTILTWEKKSRTILMSFPFPRHCINRIGTYRLSAARSLFPKDPQHINCSIPDWEPRRVSIYA